MKRKSRRQLISLPLPPPPPTHTHTPTLRHSHYTYVQSPTYDPSQNFKNYTEVPLFVASL